LPVVIGEAIGEHAIATILRRVLTVFCGFYELGGDCVRRKSYDMVSCVVRRLVCCVVIVNCESYDLVSCVVRRLVCCVVVCCGLSWSVVVLCCVVWCCVLFCSVLCCKETKTTFSRRFWKQWCSAQKHDVLNMKRTGDAASCRQMWVECSDGIRKVAKGNIMHPKRR
jgi:hypothetical protein